MIADYKYVLGLLTIVIGIVSYAIYFRSIFRGRTKPDPYSWFIWGTLAGIIFFAQLQSDGGAGAWATGFTSAICYLIAFIAYRRSSGKIKFIDALSLTGAALAILVWYFTSDPLWAVVLAVGVGAIGFVPTFIKAFRNPSEETATTYLLNGLKFAVAILALNSLNEVNVIYPASLVVMNVSLAGVLHLRA